MKKIAVLSMDIEDWYHLDYFKNSSHEFSHSMLDGVDIFKDILDKWKIKATFFTLGELAEGMKDSLRLLSDGGHEIASHGWTHKRPMMMSLKEFEFSAKKSHNEISELIGRDVLGYRAACFSIDRLRLDILKKVGYHYDSSLINFSSHSLYGTLDMSGFNEVAPSIYSKENFMEFEVSTTKVLGKNIPVSGGGYLRILPWVITNRLLSRFVASDKLYVLYIHPFELSQRPMTIKELKSNSLANKFRFLIGQKTAAEKLDKLIKFLLHEGYEFSTFEQVYRQYSK